VLALATLLEVDYQNTPSIKENSDLPSVWDRGNRGKDECDNMMKELWTLLDEQSEGCIPSGIIFLPGSRLPLKGFGWAPSTWMSGQEIDHPDPLSISQSGAKIVHGKGLAVQYPGFLLHSKQSASIYWPEDEPIHFPSDSTLLEWYEVEKADPQEKSPGGMKIGNMRFAILLCRPKPREFKEIALLVHIARKIPQKVHGSNVETNVFEAQIIHRVWIKREVRIEHSLKWKEFSDITRGRDDTKDFICGEELKNDQQWLLDGYSENLPMIPNTSDMSNSSTARLRDRNPPSTSMATSFQPVTPRRIREFARPNIVRRSGESMSDTIASSNRRRNNNTPVISGTSSRTTSMNERNAPRTRIGEGSGAQSSAYSHPERRFTGSGSGSGRGRGGGGTI
jgi:hypothetical protein